MRASHPEACAVVTALATVLAAASGGSTAHCVLLGAAVLSGQLSVGWCNDAVDAARDTAAARHDKPVAAGAVDRGAIAAAAGLALAACVPLSLAMGVLAGSAHLAGVAAAWAYNLGVKRTAASWLPYALAFGLLPAFVTLGLPGHPWPPAWALAAGALLGVGAHVTNVLPDIDADLAAGVRGLPQRLGRRRCRVLGPLPLFAASAVLVFGPPGPAGPAGWAALTLTGVLAAATTAVAVPVAVPAQGAPTGSRLPFLTTLALAVTAVALLVLHGGSLAAGTR
ncbi:UbiA family prenyltransferase [Streptomyces sp. NPDC020983]|uniref:UbiA family prenyltransferase n=1 Tax=Streptomyces sp. NPDC020983 TaxID=3365106 RepID=UPI0037B090D3